MSSSVKRFASPGGEHELLLDNVGEIRFGPPFFALSLRGRRLPSRFFGDAVKWSDDARLVAVQEWLSLAESSGPKTKLVLINASTLTETDIVVVDGGFVRPTAFTQGKIRSTADYFGTGRQVVFEHEIPSEPSWRPLP
jgi:hypothetical protein